MCCPLLLDWVRAFYLNKTELRPSTWTRLSKGLLPEQDRVTAFYMNKTELRPSTWTRPSYGLLHEQDWVTAFYLNKTELRPSTWTRLSYGLLHEEDWVTVFYLNKTEFPSPMAWMLYATYVWNCFSIKLLNKPTSVFLLFNKYSRLLKRRKTEIGRIHFT